MCWFTPLKRGVNERLCVRDCFRGFSGKTGEKFTGETLGRGVDFGLGILDLRFAAGKRTAGTGLSLTPSLSPRERERLWTVTGSSNVKGFDGRWRGLDGAHPEARSFDGA